MYMYENQIYQQLLYSKCSSYDNKFFVAKRLTDQKIIDPIFIFYVFHIYYIIGILNFSKNPTLLKDKTVKSTSHTYSLKI